ncbi:hypothetical protein F4818DRAFT_397379 [Hypoxylon cercidicola]|nr:hypothetical protein F4818DRAFT_397379 [Hypoxylon cercidicola]
MPLAFSRASGPKGRTRELSTESHYTSWWKDVRIFRRKIPTRLSFEEILRKNTSPPCSLDQFMDYLVYVERNAENLQFFLWYCGYVERWSRLPEQERERSAIWNTRKSVNPRSQTWSTMLGERTDRLNRILTVLNRDSTATCSQRASAKPESRIGHMETNFSRPRPPTPAFILKGGDQNKWRWEPFGGQPFRDEVTQIARHYISTIGPRKLNLSYRDRAACMHALQHTTHPSAFLPVLITVETALREHSHPKFIRWSTGNSNRQRVLFARAVGALLIVPAIVLDVILILSKLHRLARLSAVPFWYVGLYILLIEGRGISIGLYINHKCQLRPWEQMVDVELERVQPEVKAERAESNGPTDSFNHTTQDTTAQDDASKSKVFLKSESLRALGSANVFEREAWVQFYQDKLVWQKIFDVSVVNRNRQLRTLQDRAVLTALVWAGFLVIALTVVSVLIPSGNLLF